MSKKTRQHTIQQSLGESQEEESNSFERFTREALKQIQSTLADLQSSNHLLLKRLDTVELKMGAIEQKVNESSQELNNLKSSVDFQQETVEKLSNTFQDLAKKNEDMASEMNCLKEHSDSVSEQLNKLERFSRRNNLRLVGMEEVVDENALTLVKSFIFDHFGMESVEIERAHRVGKKPQDHGRSRQIIFKLLRYTDKVNIVRNARKTLRDTSFRIVDDLTRADLEKKRKLRPLMEQAYRDGRRVRFTDGRLYIDGKLHGDT